MTCINSPYPHRHKGKVLDFARARLAWTTPHGSVGEWRLVASAYPADSPKDRAVLGPVVMAGDVYGQERLPLTPSYTFQILATKTKHVILRDYGLCQRDTEDHHSSQFSNMEIDAPEAQMLELDVGGVLESRTHWPLTCVIKAIDRDARDWTLEFPIEHLNWRTMRGAVEFQIETGPILVPSTLLASGTAASFAGFALAYVFINRLDRADLAILSPDLAAKTRGYTGFARLNGIATALLAPDA